MNGFAGGLCGCIYYIYNVYIAVFMKDSGMNR